MEHLAEVVNKIDHSPYDIGAEALLSHLLDRGIISNDEYIVKYRGQFVHGYRTGVPSARITDYNYDVIRLTEADLFYNSSYDMLPEDAVHHTRSEIQGKGVRATLKEYKERKRQKKAAHTFFNLFEGEVFKLEVEVEAFEQTSFKELSANEISSLFYELWGVLEDFPTFLVSKFTRLLLYSYKIADNIPLTVHILLELLEENARAKERESATYSDKLQGFCLGEDIYLEVDMIMGIACEDYTKHLILEIGLLRHSTFTDCMLGGNEEKFVALFHEHFFPLEVEIRLGILFPKEEGQLELRESNDPILGYNIWI